MILQLRERMELIKVISSVVDIAMASIATNVGNIVSFCFGRYLPDLAAHDMHPRRV